MRLVQSAPGIRGRERTHPAQSHLRFHVHRRQPRHPRIAGVSAQGRSQRARNAGGRRGAELGCARRRMQGGEKRDHALVGQEHDIRQDGRCRVEAGGAQGAETQGPEGLEADRHLARAFRHRRQDHRQTDLRRRRAAPEHGACLHRAMPGIRRQTQELRRSESQRHARRESRRGRRRLGCGGSGQLVARQSGAESAAGGMGRGRKRQRQQRIHHGFPAHRDRRERGSHRTPGWYCAVGFSQFRAPHRGRVSRPVSESRHHGTADRDRNRDRGQGRSLGWHAKWRSHHCGRFRSGRHSAGEIHCPQDARGRRLWPAWTASGVHPPGGGDCADHARHAGAAAMVARGRYAPGPLSPGGAGETARCTRQGRQLDGVARASGRPVDFHHCAPGRHQERRRSGQCALLPGQPLRSAQFHQRVRHAQHPCATRILAGSSAYA